MRYFSQDVILFIDADGNRINIVEPQDFSNFTFEILKNLKLNRNDEFDEIAQRDNIYGRDNEDLWYLLFDANRKKITENCFKLEGLDSIQIPAQ